MPCCSNGNKKIGKTKKEKRVEHCQKNRPIIEQPAFKGNYLMMNNNTKLAKNNQAKSNQKKQKSYQEFLAEQTGQLREEEQALEQEKSGLGHSAFSWNDFLQLDTDNMEQAVAATIIVLQNNYRLYQEKKQAVDAIICIEPSKLHEAVDAAERLLQSQKEHTIYQRSGTLARVTKISSLPQKKMVTKGRSPDSFIIRDVDQTFLMMFLTKIGNFVFFNARFGDTKKIDCPEKIARHLIAKREWSLPILTGIINAPTLQPDGSILDKLGYDRESGLLFITSENYQWEPIRQNPTLADAICAKDELLVLLEEFPFENEASRSVALAAILTALIRKSLPTAPLFGFSAPKMSSGKSLLADVVSLIAVGKINSVIAQADNEAEEKKRILSLLMEGDPIVCYDNIERPFGSASLCAILTQCEYKDRVLGVSETRTVPTNATFLATGNNLTFAGDISTRALLCKIDAEREHPEEREFKLDLRMFIPANRVRLVQAGLIILRAYHVAGRPAQNIKPYGRFEEWSSWVRSAIVWLGMADPCETRKDIEDADPIRITLTTLFTAWHAIFGESAMKLKDVAENVNKGFGGNQNELRESLTETLLELASDNKGGINQRALAKKLSAYKNRIEGGFRLEQAGTYQGTTLWRVKEVKK